MPELPDVELYLHALGPRILNEPLEAIRVVSPFVLRSVTPPLTEVVGRRVRGLKRLGKRIVVDLGDEYFIVIHLMVAGRFQWTSPPGPRGASSTSPPGPRGASSTSPPGPLSTSWRGGMKGRSMLAAFDFPRGTLLFTEAGKKHRAALHLVRGGEALAAHDPGGIEPLEASPAAFRAALTRENHTLKRALTDPRLFSGIGNAYSDEILHAARLSPLHLTTKLPAEAIGRLYQATRATLSGWVRRLQAEAGETWPEKVTAFREGMAVHGRYRKPCPVCGSPVQRIRYAENEANYCAKCQTGGRLLADRALSRLLKDDWPRTLEELEARGMR